jgi:hypothetical protein
MNKLDKNTLEFQNGDYKTLDIKTWIRIEYDTWISSYTIMNPRSILVLTFLFGKWDGNGIRVISSYFKSTDSIKFASYNVLGSYLAIIFRVNCQIFSEILKFVKYLPKFENRQIPS